MDAWRTIADRLARSQAAFRALIEGSPDGIVVHHRGRIVYANDAVARLVGVAAPDELLGVSVFEALHPEDRPDAEARHRRIERGAAGLPFAERRVLRRDGTVAHLALTGVAIELEGVPCVVSTLRDLSEQRRLQSRLVEADRMVALGTLSAGIAHEINNPLTYLLLHVDAIVALAARLRPLVGGPAAPLLERLAASAAIAQDGAGRVRDIVRDLGVFARARDEDRQPTDLATAIERALAITGHELRRRAAVVTELPGAVTVRASQGRLTQVFVNLLINAAQALERGDPARDRVEVRLAVDGAVAAVTVRDTGCGIASEDLARVFEPFFTTKPVGEGTGLGLSIVHGIVTSLGGSVACASRPGEGATFTVRLPCASLAE